MMKVIGIRKMAVIMFCVIGIVGTIFLYLHYTQDMKTQQLVIVTGTVMATITAITGLGGYQIKQEAQMDALMNGKSEKDD